MKCEEFEENLSEYLEGQLYPEQAESIEAHALQCPVCRDTLKGVGQVCRELERLAQLSPPPGFKLGVWGGLHDRWVRRQQVWWCSLTLSLALATALTILLWPDQYSELPDFVSWEEQRQAEWVPATSRNLGHVWSEKFPELTYPGSHSHAQAYLTSF